ncbi:glutamine-hydrolyzing GMP synthase [Campylobacter upsaliensis]|nr:glutamine-hydrolyzing GMP synthase [Campylobacter upsaliensis]
MMNSLILVLDFGSQYTQLIARRLREYGVYTEIVPYFEKLDSIKSKNPKGIILSGGPASVYEEGAYKPDSRVFELNIPVLGICYGMQYIAHFFGGSVVRAKAQEFGKAVLEISDLHTPLFENVKQDSIVWMSHADKVESLPSGFVELAKSGNTHYCAIADFKRQIYALQFHPEVVHSECGGEILKNFAVGICGADTSWNMRNFAESEIIKLREKVLGGGAALMSETCHSELERSEREESSGDSKFITQRLRISKLKQDDSNALRNIFGDSRIMECFPNGIWNDEKIASFIQEQRSSYDKYGYGIFAVIEKASNECVGCVGFVNEGFKDCLELQYFIRYDKQKLGYATEAIEALKEYAKELGIKHLYCLIDGENTHSSVFAKKLGFEKIAKNAIKNGIDVPALCGELSCVYVLDLEINNALPLLGATSKVLCAVSGGVDSSVVATLLYRAIGENLIPVFVDTGLLRKGEREAVEEMFRENLKVPLIVADAKELFLGRLKGVTEPEQKRKIIGETFIEVFEAEAKKHNTKGEIKFLAQGTLYPDVIESVSVKGPSKTIKSHHNVGGLPEWMKFELIEPLRELFKDEVRALGRELGMPESMLMRHPFPGPGLAIRIMGEVNSEDLEILKEADSIFIEELHKWGLYDSVWQAFCVLLNVRSVGVMGDNRTYDNTICVRAVEAMDGMTASFSHLPHAFLESVSNRIINEVAGINRVVYDITSKPPGTIEWE